MSGSAPRDPGPLGWALLLCASCAPPATPSTETSAATAAPACTAVATPMAPVVVADPQHIAVGLEASLANLVMDGDRARLTARPAPFLRRGHLWNLEYRGKSHPTYACIGELPGAPSVELGSAEALVAFARSAGLGLDDEVARVAYVKTYLELDGLNVVESGSEIPFTVAASLDSGLGAVDAGADADRETRVLEEGFRNEYERLVEQRRTLESKVVPSLAPLCLHGRGPFLGVVYALDSRRDLLRLKVALQSDGTVTTHDEVVARDLPVHAVAPCARPD